VGFATDGKKTPAGFESRAEHGRDVQSYKGLAALEARGAPALTFGGRSNRIRYTPLHIFFIIFLPFFFFLVISFGDARNTFFPSRITKLISRVVKWIQLLKKVLLLVQPPLLMVRDLNNKIQATCSNFCFVLQ
jgi:hypothetical protein